MQSSSCWLRLASFAPLNHGTKLVADQVIQECSADCTAEAALAPLQPGACPCEAGRGLQGAHHSAMYTGRNGDDSHNELDQRWERGPVGPRYAERGQVEGLHQCGELPAGCEPSAIDARQVQHDW